MKNIPWKWFPHFAESALFWSASAHAEIDRWYVWCIAIDGVFKTLSDILSEYHSVIFHLRDNTYIHMCYLSFIRAPLNALLLRCQSPQGMVKIPAPACRFMLSSHSTGLRTPPPLWFRPFTWVLTCQTILTTRLIYRDKESAAVMYELLQMKHWSTILNPGLTKQWWDIYLQITQITCGFVLYFFELWKELHLVCQAKQSERSMWEDCI